MPEPARAYGAIRRYKDADLQRLRFIRHARELGFALDEIADLLKLDDGMDCGQAQRIAAVKRAAIRQRVAQLKKIDQVLSELLLQCQSKTETSCPLITALGEAKSLVPD